MPNSVLMDILTTLINLLNGQAGDKAVICKFQSSRFLPLNSDKKIKL
jgi:hypothetical protein